MEPSQISAYATRNCQYIDITERNLEFSKTGFLYSGAKRQAREGDSFMTRHNTLQYGERSIRYTDAKSWNNIHSLEHQAISFSDEFSPFP